MSNHRIHLLAPSSATFFLGLRRCLPLVLLLLAQSKCGTDEDIQRKRFADKVVIITGSSAGIGQDAAIEFAKEGAKVVIHGRDKKRLDETEAMIIEEANVSANEVLKVIGNIEDEETTEAIYNQTMEKFGKINILVNNAGTLMKPGTTELFDLHNLDYIYNVGLRSIVHLTKLCLEELIKQKGVVLNVSSVASIIPVTSAPFYASIKAALDQWTRSLAKTYGPYQVRINSINPGPISNTLIARSRGSSSTMPSDQAIAAMTALGRVGSVSEVSAAMKFLCSAEASFITGVIFLVDGGMAFH